MSDEPSNQPHRQQRSYTALQPVWFTVLPYVSVGADRRLMVQQLADHLQMMTRVGTRERYPSAAEVFLLSADLELVVPGQEVPHLLVHGWVDRPWHQDDEWRLVITDFFEAVSSWFLSKYPFPGGRAPACMPIIAKVSEKLVAVSEFAAHTQRPLPAGWADQIAWHDGLLPMGPMD